MNQELVTIDEPGVLAAMAASYALCAAFTLATGVILTEVPEIWPLSDEDWRPGEIRETLVKARDLIEEEIKRMDSAPEALESLAEKGGRGTAEVDEKINEEVNPDGPI